MLINNKQRDRRDEIKVNVQGTDIDSMNSIKLLGVTIDHKVNFSVHINITCKKANQMIGVLMRHHHHHHHHVYLFKQVDFIGNCIS